MNQMFQQHEPNRELPPLVNPFMVVPTPDDPRQERMKEDLGEELFEALEGMSSTFYASRVISRGGQHLVFEIPYKETPKKMRSVVTKVNYGETLNAFTPDDLLDDQGRSRGLWKMRDVMSKRKEDLETLRIFFGKKSVLAHRFYIADVPITKGLLQVLRPDWLPEGKPLAVDRMPAWIEIQKRIDLDPETSLTMTGYYLEAPEGDIRSLNDPEYERELYAKAHHLLTLNRSEDVLRETQLDIIREVHPELGELIDASGEDAGVQAAVRDAVDKCLRYSAATGRSLDLGGLHNMSLVKEDDHWQIRLLDVLPTAKMQVLSRVARSLEEDMPVLEWERFHAVNAMNYVRMVNALAIISEHPERMRVEGLDQVPPEQWYAELAKVWPNEKADVVEV